MKFNEYLSTLNDVDLLELSNSSNQLYFEENHLVNKLMVTYFNPNKFRNSLLSIQAGIISELAHRFKKQEPYKMTRGCWLPIHLATPEPSLWVELRLPETADYIEGYYNSLDNTWHDRQYNECNPSHWRYLHKK